MSDFVRSMLVTRRQIGGEYVFPGNSKAGYIAEPKFAFELIRNACELRVSPRDLRRTFLTVAESTDISPLALKAPVNHATGSDVTAGYASMLMERLPIRVQASAAWPASPRPWLSSKADIASFSALRVYSTAL